MKKKIDMSPQAVTNRMLALDELWELAVALKSSKIEDEPVKTSKVASVENETQKSEK